MPDKPRFILKPREKEREFDFSEGEFRALSDLVHKKTGIVLRDHKMNMVYSRLARRLRVLAMGSFKEYLLYLNGKKGEAEISSLINAITTNLTHFFREKHHFEHFSTVVMPQLLGINKLGKTERIRVWSAGCSSGEEPYSISMMMDQAIKTHSLQRLDAKILATDLDTNMLKLGRDGFYKSVDMSKIPKNCQFYFENSEDNPNVMHLSDELREMISFKELNLLSKWPMKGTFDVIFCRNVMIYFDGETKQKLIQRFSHFLKPGGWLYIGHSETIVGNDHHLKLHGRTIYQRSESDMI